MSIDPDRIGLNSATTCKPWDSAAAIDAVGREVAAGMICDTGLDAGALCRGGHFTEDGATPKRALDDTSRAAEIGAACLVKSVGGVASGTREIAEQGAARTLEIACTGCMPIAIEPLHPMTAEDRACVNTAGDALDPCDGLGAGIWVALDVSDIRCDPDIIAPIARVWRDRPLAFHPCDRRHESRSLLTDRAMMGDAVANIAGLRPAVDALGVDGRIAVEIVSDEWWRKPGDEVLSTIVDRARRHV